MKPEYPRYRCRGTGRHRPAKPLRPGGGQAYRDDVGVDAVAGDRRLIPGVRIPAM